MPTAVIISLATGGPPPPPDINTGYSFSDKLRFSRRAKKQNSTRRTTTRRRGTNCC